MKLRSGTGILAGRRRRSLLALGACSADKTADSAPRPPQGPGRGNGERQGRSARSRVDLIVEQGAGSGRPDTPEARKAIIDQLALQMVVAEEAVKKGLDKTPEVAEQIDAIRQSVLANAYVQDFIKNNPVSDDMREGRVRAHQGDDHRHRIQGAPHPGGKGSRSQGHHRQAQEGPGRVREAGDGEIEGPGLQGPWRRSGLVRSERDGAGIRRRREQAGEGQVHARSRSRPSSATTSSCWRTRSRSRRRRWKRSSPSSPSSCSSRT